VLSSAIAAALSAARREERAAIVAHLRERVGGGEHGGGFAKLATSIERGDHIASSIRSPYEGGGR
jgi:hypothetical protein